MYWAVKLRHRTFAQRHDDPPVGEGQFGFRDGGGLDIVMAWAVAIGMFLLLLVSSMLP